MYYRSKGVSSDYFRKVGTVHLHIDGGGSENLIPKIEEIVIRLDKKGFPGKVNKIIKAVEGPQRRDRDYLHTYGSHTPGVSLQEQFEFFSTTGFGDRQKVEKDMIDSIREILNEFQNVHGIVVETERVIATIGEKNEWEDASPLLIASIDEEEVGYKRSYTAPIEIHHAFDLETGSQPPFEIDNILQDTTQRGIRVGGWFLFDRGDAWSYRSNLFAEYDDFKEIAQEYHVRLSEYLRTLERGFKIWTLVEQIIGIWKTGRIGSSKDDILSIPQLARWEMSNQEIRDFWVVAANFLGDKDPDFRNAMLHNLKRGVNYKYFLHSFSDVQRLRQLVKSLSEELREDISERIQPVLLWRTPELKQSGLFKEDYLIADPWSSKNAEGYKLRRDQRGNVQSGKKLLSNEIQLIVKRLTPLLKIELQGIRLPTFFGSREFAIMYTDLENASELRQQIEADMWESMLDGYDGIVANEVSKVGG